MMEVEDIYTEGDLGRGFHPFMIRTVADCSCGNVIFGPLYTAIDNCGVFYNCPHCLGTGVSKSKPTSDGSDRPPSTIRDGRSSNIIPFQRVSETIGHRDLRRFGTKLRARLVGIRRRWSF